ncbi:hypothetical protein [Natrinema sp. 1APR25-10V2]|uniref:hypothetical protein n=1 Tax=Natrinema sp. 1APR25-10V2 TaxID=2951081 RepID=UPI0028749BA4|nr:hypothetical protein [Natrinema sp. 1APR25-10V2]MDS0474575.1 hypothetical protein [Natrinema sp. 1APR25-10V2]
MKPFENEGSDDQFQTAGKESEEHLWGKVELYRRKCKEIEPWFQGEYRFERKVADRVPDCFVLGELVNRWFEFVAGSNQDYRAKTREALRLGFVIYWVFHIDHREQIQDVRQALTPELQEPCSFGVYDPQNGVLEIGEPITYKSYEFPVEGMNEFRPRKILGYRSGAARIGQSGGGFDLGLFDLAGCQRRLITGKYGRHFRAVAPNQSLEDAPWDYPTRDGLKRLVEEGQVTRLGPVRHRNSSVDEL